MRKGKKEKESKRSDRRSKARKTLEVWEVALSPFDSGAELANRQCCSRRTTKKNGGSDEDATRSADQRKQMDGGNTKRCNQPKGEDRMEMKKEARRLRGARCSMGRHGAEKNR